MHLDKLQYTNSPTWNVGYFGIITPILTTIPVTSEWARFILSYFIQIYVYIYIRYITIVINHILLLYYLHYTYQIAPPLYHVMCIPLYPYFSWFVIFIKLHLLTLHKRPPPLSQIYPRYVHYPLEINVAIGNGHRNSWFTYSTLWFSIAMLVYQRIPSGKRLHNYGKSPCFMGKLTINGHFQ